MRMRHVEAYRVASRATLRAWGVRIGQSFYTLTAAQVDAVLVEAARCRYQKPRNANGSRARYFYEMTQRRAV